MEKVPSTIQPDETEEYESELGATFEHGGVNYSVKYAHVEPSPRIGEKQNSEIKLTSIQNVDTYEDIPLDSKVAAPLRDMAQAESDVLSKKFDEERPDLMDGSIEDGS